MPNHLLAIDPAASKPSWGAEFIDGKFQRFIKIDYRKLVKLEDIPRNISFAKPNGRHICVIERPYVHQGHSPASHITLAIAVGEIAFYMRLQNFKVEFADSWGNQGWLQQFFGRISRERMLLTAQRVAKADGIEHDNTDQAIAYCLGRWRLGRAYVF